MQLSLFNMDKLMKDIENSNRRTQRKKLKRKYKEKSTKDVQLSLFTLERR